MGYYTCFTLDVRTTVNSAEHVKKYEIIAALRKENEHAACALDKDGQTESDAKWYDSADELKQFSTKFPDALLVLDGDGENNDDFWIAYFLNGKAQVCSGRIEYDEFDPDKLQ